MAQVIDIYQTELLSECRQLRRTISVKQYNHKRRLRRLNFAVSTEPDHVKHILAASLKMKNNHEIRKYNEYEQAYRLLCVQLENLLKSWSQSTISLGIERPPKGNMIKAWRDYQFNLEDAFEDLERLAENEFRKRILGLLAVTDTLERLQEIGLPANYATNILFTFYLMALDMQTNLQIALRRRRIKPIPLNKGDYPPVETTRIIAKENRDTGDRLTILKVVERGYTYKGLVLRKAAVIVKT